MIHLTFTYAFLSGRTKEPGRVGRSRRTRRNPVKKVAILTRMLYARQKTHSGFTRPEQGARGAANRAGDRKENPPRFRPLRSPTRSLPGSLPDICSVGIFSGSRRNRAPSALQPRGGEGEAAQKPLKKRQTAALAHGRGALGQSGRNVI